MSPVWRTILFISFNTQIITSFIYQDNVTVLDQSFKLFQGDKITHTSSEGTITRLNMQGDGNLVLYYNDSSLWSTKTNPDGEYTILTANGNLQVIVGQNTSIWQSQTRGHDNGAPHTIVVADKCAYIMDSDTNVFWTTDRKSNCSEYRLDLVIQTATETRPIESTVLTPRYGGDVVITNMSIHLNQGRINAINDWGMYNNTLFIRDWNSDHQEMDNPCEPFILNDKDYIIGYNIYDSIDYIHGITLYTSLGCEYHCVDEIGGTSITNHDIVSYYYDVNDFWYLSGVYGSSEVTINSLQLQFTQLELGTNLSTSDKLLCHPTSAPTFAPTKATYSPTNQATSAPTNEPTINPTQQTAFPTIIPTSYPTFLSTILPTINPTSERINEPTVQSSHDHFFNSTLNQVYNTNTGTTHTPHRLLISSILGYLNGKNAIYIVVLLIFLCFICALSVAIFLMKRNARKKRKHQQVMGVQSVEVAAAKHTQITVAESSDEEANTCDNEKMEVMQWLRDTVKLPQYYECFVQNGYDNMEFVKNICDLDKSEMAQIGINKPGHQTRIFAQVMVLNATQVQENEGIGEDNQIMKPMLPHLSNCLPDNTVLHSVLTTPVEQFETDGKGNDAVETDLNDQELVEFNEYEVTMS